MVTKTNDWNEIVYWNKVSYGKATKIQRKTILSIISIICLITPATNWLIPIFYKKIKTGVVIRHD